MIYIACLIWALLFSHLWLKQSTDIADRQSVWLAIAHWFTGAIGMTYVITICLRELFL